jgi:hypothetical protein
MGDGTNSAIRAFGARAVHVIAGNTPAVAFNTVLRSAVTRSDCITKTPSNDPLTFVAILRTMIELDPTHPVTRHFSGSYWKGGNEQFESRLYRPEHVEKIVAWGGFDSIKHITKYLQPGLDLITLDPKHSASVIGYEALASEDSLRDVAQRAACDIGAYNQELCANARMIYVGAVGKAQPPGRIYLPGAANTARASQHAGQISLSGPQGRARRSVHA